MSSAGTQSGLDGAPSRSIITRTCVNVYLGGLGSGGKWIWGIENATGWLTGGTVWGGREGEGRVGNGTSPFTDKWVCENRSCQQIHE
jgi:hypothetical protein